VSETSLQSEIEAAAGYEDLLVPALFRQWVGAVLDAAQILPGHRVLDVACGTGVLAREAADRVGFAGYVAGVDPDRGMLAVAERLAQTPEWRQGTAESLPYPEECFDVVVSQFGLMFFADRRKALKEMLRVLTPQGRLAIAVWDSLENVPAYATEVALLDRVAGASAANAVRAPFVLGARRALLTLFEGAGVSSVAIETHGGFPEREDHGRGGSEGLVAGDGSRIGRGADPTRPGRSGECAWPLRDWRRGCGVRCIGAHRHGIQAIAGAIVLLVRHYPASHHLTPEPILIEG